MSYDDQHGYGDPGRGEDARGGSGQTRTRLPEHQGGSRPARRPARSASSRNLVMVVGVVVLLVAAIAFANRGPSSGDNDGASGPETAPTAPTGEKPVDGKAAGIPSGFARSEQGAQSAAANYAVALGSDGMFVTDRRHEIVNTVYTQAAAGELRAPMDSAYSAEFLAKLGLDAEGNAPEGSTFVSRTVPVGTKVSEYSLEQAKVEVWYLGLIGMSGANSTDPVRSTWKTWTFDLQWDDGWKVVQDSQKDGPAPVPGDVPASSSDEISKAVEEYGGFTYAR